MCIRTIIELEAHGLRCTVAFPSHAQNRRTASKMVFQSLPCRLQNARNESPKIAHINQTHCVQIESVASATASIGLG
ncbi:hypothetical protein GCM10009000_013930 [Halobacterium noricense]|uniref:Transposase n=1 Tax=Haladaptatus pallidirubidus TaxID=1008152 RepID=A0AAV3UBI2_9EURY